MHTSLTTSAGAHAGFARHLRSVLLLPFMNAVVIPFLILLAAQGRYPLPVGTSGAAAIALNIASLVLFAGGAALVLASIGLFVRKGEGTLAPWDPPQKLVASGVYRIVRNPMKTGLFCLLLAEALVLRSLPLLGWFALFATVNVLYIRYSEEPGLRKRFGEDYDRYCAQVPRWLPRSTLPQLGVGPRLS